MCLQRSAPRATAALLSAHAQILHGPGRRHHVRGVDLVWQDARLVAPPVVASDGLVALAGSAPPRHRRAHEQAARPAPAAAAAAGRRPAARAPCHSQPAQQPLSQAAAPEPRMTAPGADGRSVGVRRDRRHVGGLYQQLRTHLVNAVDYT